MTSKYSSIDGGRLLADHEPILMRDEGGASERLGETTTGAADLSYNNMLLRPDGTVMTVEQIKDLRQRQGYCLTCPGEPVKLYAIKKSKFNPLYKSKEPIHAVHLSDNGVCLRCNPGMDPNRGHRRGSMGGPGPVGVDMMPVHSMASPPAGGHVQSRRRNSMGGPVAVPPPSMKTIAMTALATRTIDNMSDHRGPSAPQASTNGSSPSNAPSRASPPSGSGHKSAKRSLSPKLFPEHQGSGSASSSSHGVASRDLDDPFGRRDRAKKNSSNRSMHRSLSPTPSLRMTAEGRMGSDRSNISSKSISTSSQKQQKITSLSPESMEIDPNEWNDFADFPSTMETTVGEPEDETADADANKKDDANNGKLRNKLERKDSVDSDGFIDQSGQDDEDRQSVQSGFQSSFLNFDPNAMESSEVNMLNNGNHNSRDGSTHEDDASEPPDDDDTLFFDDMKQAIKNSLGGTSSKQSSEMTSEPHDGPLAPQETFKMDGEEQSQQHGADVPEPQDYQATSTLERRMEYEPDREETEDDAVELDSTGGVDEIDNRLTQEELQDEMLDRMNMLQATLSSLVGSTETRLGTIEKQVTSVLQQQSILLAQHATILKLMQQQRLQSLTNGSAHGASHGASNSSLSYSQSHMSINAHGVEATGSPERPSFHNSNRDAATDVNETTNSRRSHRGSRRRLMDSSIGGSSRRRRKSREVERLSSPTSADYHDGDGSEFDKNTLGGSDRSMDVPATSGEILQEKSQKDEVQELPSSSSRNNGDGDVDGDAVVVEEPHVTPGNRIDDDVKVEGTDEGKGKRVEHEYKEQQQESSPNTVESTLDIGEGTTDTQDRSSSPNTVERKFGIGEGATPVDNLSLPGQVTDIEEPETEEGDREGLEDEEKLVQDRREGGEASDNGEIGSTAASSDEENADPEGDNSTPFKGSVPTERDDTTDATAGIQNDPVDPVVQEAAATSGSPLEFVEQLEQQYDQLAAENDPEMMREQQDDDGDVATESHAGADDASLYITEDVSNPFADPTSAELDSSENSSPTEANSRDGSDAVPESGNVGPVVGSGSAEGVSGPDSHTESSPPLEESEHTKGSRKLKRSTSSDEAENTNEASRRRSHRKLKRGTSRRSGDMEDIENGSSRRKHSSRRVKSSSSGHDSTIREDNVLHSSDRRKSSSNRRMKRGASAGCEGRNSLAHLTVAEEGRRRSSSSSRIPTPKRSSHELEEAQGGATEAETTDFEVEEYSDRAGSVHNSEPIPEMDEYGTNPAPGLLGNGNSPSHEVSRVSVVMRENEELMKTSRKDSGDAERRKTRKGKRTVTENEVIAALGLKNERKEKKKKSSDRRMKTPKRERKSSRRISNGSDAGQPNEFSEASAYA